MKKYLPLLLCTLCFGKNIDELYKEAQNLENQGNYKEAMLLYKKLADLNISEEDKYILDLSKNDEHKVESFTNMKKAFYQKQIDKVNDKETDENLKQMITGDFSLYPYKKNYLLPVTYDFNQSEDRSSFETDFQISIEKPIAYNFFGLNESISTAYTQRSFWQTAEHSSPFRETNYEPEIFIQFPHKDTSVLKSYKVALNHISNGRNDEYSRSWNRLYFESYFQLANLFIIPKVWYRIPENSSDDDNPDIEDYFGYGDLTFLYAYKKHTFELALRNNLEFNETNKGSTELNWTFPLPEFLSNLDSYGFFQIFSGYGNSLIDYNREVHKVGLGIAFSR
ncbi:MAG: phospholipase A [Aliarcobacter sp.]|nr:phospholipase A [Aliarcobacter sp.]